MARRPLALAFVVSVFALLAQVSCSKDEDPECSKDSDCKSATTGCTVGVCRDGKCAANPVADGTRVADQTPVKDKSCVALKCKAGVAVEAADTSKTPAAIECKKQYCDGTNLKVENILDGVACAGGGACIGGVCKPPVDSGPPTDTGTDTGSTDETGADTGSTSETGTDATTD